MIGPVGRGHLTLYSPILQVSSRCIWLEFHTDRVRFLFSCRLWHLPFEQWWSEFVDERMKHYKKSPNMDYACGWLSSNSNALALHEVTHLWIALSFQARISLRSWRCWEMCLSTSCNAYCDALCSHHRISAATNDREPARRYETCHEDRWRYIYTLRWHKKTSFLVAQLLLTNIDR